MRWEHPRIPEPITISGHDGDDAKPYQEQEVRAAVRRASEEEGGSHMVEQPAYSMLIRWSEEDGAFLVTLPEWDGRLQNWHAATHGATYADAAKNGQEVLEMLVEHAQDRGEALPQPRGFAMSA